MAIDSVMETEHQKFLKSLIKEIFPGDEWIIRSFGDGYTDHEEIINTERNVLSIDVFDTTCAEMFDRGKIRFWNADDSIWVNIDDPKSFGTIKKFVLENVEKWEKKVKDSDFVSAKDIHPSLLEGLIPVSHPAFIGKDGKAKACKAIATGIDFAIEPLQNMPMLYGCVQKAKELRWEYLFQICDHEGKSVIRGC